jgi:tetratricopeptide (TPR) repeat protein
MTTTVSMEYRTLERETSNDLIRHDARRGDGEYAEAAWHALRAARGRRRMGALMRDEGEFAWAVADWLAASACFFLATQPDLMSLGLEKVRELDRAGLIPPDRRDLRAALREREAELESLRRRMTAFLEEYARRFGAAPVASADTLDYLRAHVRELPGFARLHFALYRQARLLGDSNLAAEHLRWAAEFAPDEAEYVGRYGYQLIGAGRPDQAAEIARRFLTNHPQEASIRIVLAHALASRGGARAPDQQTALELLREAAADPSAGANVRLAAVALSGAIRRARGEHAEAIRLLTRFDEFVGERTTSDPVVAAVRGLFAAGANGNGSIPDGLEAALAEPIRAELFRHEEELTAVG